MGAVLARPTYNPIAHLHHPQTISDLSLEEPIKSITLISRLVKRRQKRPTLFGNNDNN